MSIACADRQCFCTSLETIHALIRRERRPLPFCDVNGAHYRRWATDTCMAEVRHAADDFWTCVHHLGVAGLFDRDDGVGGHEAPFRLPREIHAFAALGWLSHLQAHESDRNGPWACVRWRTWDVGRRRDWFARRRYLWSGFVRQVRAIVRLAGSARSPAAGMQRYFSRQYGPSSITHFKMASRSSDVAAGRLTGPPQPADTMRAFQRIKGSLWHQNS